MLTRSNSRTGDRSRARGFTVHIRPNVPASVKHPRSTIRNGDVNGTKPSRDWRGPAVAGIRIASNGTVILGGRI